MPPRNTISGAAAPAAQLITLLTPRVPLLEFFHLTDASPPPASPPHSDYHAHSTTTWNLNTMADLPVEIYPHLCEKIGTESAKLVQRDCTVERVSKRAAYVGFRLRNAAFARVVSADDEGTQEFVGVLGGRPVQAFIAGSYVTYSITSEENIGLLARITFRAKGCKYTAYLISTVEERQELITVDLAHIGGQLTTRTRLGR